MLRRGLLKQFAYLVALATNRGWAAAADSSVAKAVGTKVAFGSFGFSDGMRWMTTRAAHVVPAAARDIQLVYGNFAPTPTAYEFADVPPIRIRAAIEYPTGQIHPATFGGATEYRLPGGQIAVSDPIDIRIPDGATMFSRTNVVADDTPYRWPLNRISIPQSGDWVTSGTDPGEDMFTPPPPDKIKRVRCLMPYNILGKTDRPQVSVAILGDSVVSAEGGLGDALGNWGYVERALATRVAWCNLATGGDAASSFLTHGLRRLTLIDHHFTHVICALGIGDIRDGHEDQIKQHLSQLWQELASRGLKVFQTTITTETLSTDKWTTAAGQTIKNPNFLPGGIYHRINDWIRSTPAPLAGCFDAAAATETALDSGIWLAPDHHSLTIDGPHMNALGAVVASKCIDVSRLKLD